MEKVFGKCKKSLGFCTDGIYCQSFLENCTSCHQRITVQHFNLSITSGVFPNCWKIARVALIFKSGQSDNRSNYRPIIFSMLSFLSRIFEKLVLNQLYAHLDKNKLIYYK